MGNQASTTADSSSAGGEGAGPGRRRREDDDDDAAADGLQVDFPSSDDEYEDDETTHVTGASTGSTAALSVNSRIRRSVLLVNRRLLDDLNKDNVPTTTTTTTPVHPSSSERPPDDPREEPLREGPSRPPARIMNRGDSVRSGLTATSGSVPPLPENADHSPKVRGLPGFLRRSIRNPYDDVGATTIRDDVVRTNDDADRDRTTSTSVPDADADADVDAETTPRKRNDHAQTNDDDDPVRNVAKELSRMNSRPERARSDQSFFDGSSPSSSSKKDAVADNGGVKPSLDRAKSYKVTSFEKCINAPVVDLRELKRLGWNGIPPEHRADAWKLLLGYLPANRSRRTSTLERRRREYRDAIAQHYDIDDQIRTAQEQETLRQVLVDVPRTAPDVPLFRDNRTRRVLARLLYIWAVRHPASSYVQGINDLVTPLIVVFLSGEHGGQDVTDGAVVGTTPPDALFAVEADAYWCLTRLLSGIQDHYTCDQPGVQRMVFRLEELVRRIDAALDDHLREKGIEFIQFAFKWMNCLLLREFSLRCVLRLWDTYLSEGDGGFEDFHVYVCAAFLCQFSAEVREKDFDELFGFMQNMPTENWGDAEIEVLLSQAFVLSTLFGGSDAHLTSGSSNG